MATVAKEGSLSARMAGRTSRKGYPRGPQSDNCKSFVRHAERTVHGFAAVNTDWVDDVFNTLVQVRSEFDSTHHEAEQKEAQLKRLREDIRTADMLATQKNEELSTYQAECQDLDKQYTDTMAEIKESHTNKKVYLHMLARIQKEQAILKEKMLRMEQHLARKKLEVEQQQSAGERVKAERAQRERAHSSIVHDMDYERDACKRAREDMKNEVARRDALVQERQNFENWRKDVAREAANEAFNASAGRLRKLYAIEKLAGNSLQKVTFEQVERSQTTEDGFQKIREVTGLADVMDIVHKFLNRDVEHEQLRSSVKDAEVLLEALRQEFDAFKRDTEGMTFDKSSAGIGRSGEIYKEIESSERKLNEAMEQHELCRTRLQKTTLQVEHMKRWCLKTGNMLAKFFPEPVRVEGPQDLKVFFKQLGLATEQFLRDVERQIKENTINKKKLAQDTNKEYLEQARLLTDKSFLQRNCRVSATADDPAKTAPKNQGAGGGGGDNDPDTSFAEERDRVKKDSEHFEREHARKGQKL